MSATSRPRLILGVVALAVLLAGCGGGGAASPGRATPSPTPTATPYVFKTPPPISTPALTADGLGPIRLDTPAQEAVAQGWATRDDGCGWRTAPALLSEGVELYFADDRISEVWLGSAAHSTDVGARVGMHVEQIATLYAGELTYETRNSLGGRVILPIVRQGDHELLFFGLGDEDATPGPRAPLTGIGARPYGADLTRPTC